MRRAAGWIAAASLLSHAALGTPVPEPLPAAASAEDSPVHWATALLAGERSLLTAAAVDPDWHIAPAPPDDPGTPALTDAHPQDHLLREALRSHLDMAHSGGWPVIPDSAVLRFGSRDPVVALLRRRLRLSGDHVSEMGADPWFFDTGMDAAVRHFQARHGLPIDGVFGDLTRAAANVSIEERIGQIAVTLERWRWLPADLGPRYVWVNIGSASLDVIEAGGSVLAMRVIVGHPDRPTPGLAGELRQVVFNPTWSVPRTIAVEDLLPRQIDDPGFLASRGFRVLRWSGGAEREIDPAQVQWQRLGPDNFPYRLRQDAGPGNSLGRIRIGWDNPYDIYLHDTPARGLFGLRGRTLSSGCIRLEDAPALATLLLAHDRAWSPAETATRISALTTQVINLRTTLPIYIVYLTSWVTDDGVVHFRRDIYGRDARVLAALRYGNTL